MEVEIKKATIKNLKDIQELNRQLCIFEKKSWDKTINKDYPITEKGIEYFKERINNKKGDGCALVAIVDNKIIGYFVGGINEPEDYRNIKTIAEAENTFILEGYRNKGIGGKLFKEFLKWAKSKKADRIRAVASLENINSINFYKKQGLKGYDLVMEKEFEA